MSRMDKVVVAESIAVVVGGEDWGGLGVISSSCGTVKTSAVPRNPYREGGQGSQTREFLSHRHI